MSALHRLLLRSRPAALAPRGRSLHNLLVPSLAEPIALSAGLTQFLQVSPPLAAQVLFLSPMQAMSHFKAEKTTGSVSALPYAAMAANGVAWTTYGALGSDATIMLANIPPALLGSYYCYTFYQYRSPDAVTLPYFGGAALFSGGVGLAAAMLPTTSAQLVIGYAGVAVCTVMFAGPLAAIKTVLAQRSAESLPLAYTLAGVANCTLWTSYGALVIHDPFVWGPNSMGLAFSLAQLGLIGRFGTRKPTHTPAESDRAGSVGVGDGVQAAKEVAAETVATAKAVTEAVGSQAKKMQ